jgi:hypothetical protein
LFHNVYEQSKYEAEKIIRSTPSVRATIYRPSIIVGASRNGARCSQMGFHRFVAVALRIVKWLQKTASSPERIRLPLNGDESWNLVPMDWVAETILRLLSRSENPARTFHLTNSCPVTAKAIYEVAASELGITCIDFAGRDQRVTPNKAEASFFEAVQDYLPYLVGDPEFCNANTIAALPDFPAPMIDRPRLTQLVRSADEETRLKSKRQTCLNDRNSLDEFCITYLERDFPQQVVRSRWYRQFDLNLTMCIRLDGVQPIRWLLTWSRGELVSVIRTDVANASVTVRIDPETFVAVVKGHLTPQAAFFDQRVEISGDVELALKLTYLLELLLKDQPWSSSEQGARELMVC